MSPSLATSPLRNSSYICRTCRSSLHSSEKTYFVSARAFRTASSRVRAATSPQVSWYALNKRVIYSPTIPPGEQRLIKLQSYSTATSPPQPINATLVPLEHRSLISLSGPDAAKFLQGLVTNNVDPSRQSPFYSAFLDARGRVLWDVFIWTWPELAGANGADYWACYIEVDKSEVEALKSHLKRHKLRSKVQIQDIRTEGTKGLKVWAAWGPSVDTLGGDSIIQGFHDPRAPGMYRFLAETDHIVGQGLIPGTTDEYHVQRYRNGIPEGPKEITRESALPMECNIDLNQGIDFKKGCYVGQELTIRTKHTGVVRKRILPVQISDLGASGTPPEPGADIKQLDENGEIKKGRAAGKFIAGIGDVGLALCRLENMTSMKISAEGGTWKPGMEFGIQMDGTVVRIKPILHEWFVLRERQMWDKKRVRI